jgi:hypothetical protein
MGWFGSSKRQQEEAAASAAAADARRSERQARERRADAWRADRNAVLPRLHAAQRAHADAQRTYNRYAPGPQKDAAADAVNVAAAALAEVEQEFKLVDDYRTWDQNH